MIRQRNRMPMKFIFDTKQLSLALQNKAEEIASETNYQGEIILNGTVVHRKAQMSTVS